jgi:hypothetical protein
VENGSSCLCARSWQDGFGAGRPREKVRYFRALAAWSCAPGVSNPSTSPKCWISIILGRERDSEGENGGEPGRGG